jgi:hypothetical protein
MCIREAGDGEQPRAAGLCARCGPALGHWDELPPDVRRIVFGECARVLKAGGRLVLVDSLQRGDEPDYEGLLDLFPQNYHEPYYAGCTTEDFGAIASACGLIHRRDVKASSPRMVFDKPEAE